jgi:hypothetical protein
MFMHVRIGEIHRKGEEPKTIVYESAGFLGVLNIKNTTTPIVPQ